MSPSSRETTRRCAPRGRVDGRFGPHISHIGRSTRSTASRMPRCHMMATACPSTCVAILPWLGPPLVKAHPDIRGTPPRWVPPQGPPSMPLLIKSRTRPRDHQGPDRFRVPDEKASRVINETLLNRCPGVMQGPSPSIHFSFAQSTLRALPTPPPPSANAPARPRARRVVVLILKLAGEIVGVGLHVEMAVAAKD